MSNLYSYITGDDILTISEEEKESIIEGMLYKSQYVLFIAEEKVGKTILTQQLVCSLSTGNALFKTFDISKPCKVWYMFNEVNENELKGRFIRMKNGIGMDTSNTTLINLKFRFNTSAGKEELSKMVAENKDNPPDVIILDALYKAVSGSLSKDDVINDFNYTFSKLAYDLGCCARIVVHHLNKPSKDEKGKFRARTDKDSFGSAYLLADPDHVFRLEKYGDDPNSKDRILKCDTQRSGNIIETTRLRLIEPNPLYFEIVSVHTEEKAKMLKLLDKEKEPLKMSYMIKKLGIGRTTGYIVAKELGNEGLVSKIKSNPVLFYLTSMADIFNKPAKETEIECT